MEKILRVEARDVLGKAHPARGRDDWIGMQELPQFGKISHQPEIWPMAPAHVCEPQRQSPTQAAASQPNPSSRLCNPAEERRDVRRGKTTGVRGPRFPSQGPLSSRLRDDWVGVATARLLQSRGPRHYVDTPSESELRFGCTIGKAVSRTTQTRPPGAGAPKNRSAALCSKRDSCVQEAARRECRRP